MIDVVNLDDALAVVAKNSWQADRALQQAARQRKEKKYPGYKERKSKAHNQQRRQARAERKGRWAPVGQGAGNGDGDSHGTSLGGAGAGDRPPAAASATAVAPGAREPQQDESSPLDRGLELFLNSDLSLDELASMVGPAA